MVCLLKDFYYFCRRYLVKDFSRKVLKGKQV